MSFSVVIPSKTAANLKACIAAIRKHEPGLPDEKIIVVDDGIEWFTVPRTPMNWADMRPPHHNFCLVQGIKPFIFSRNCNIGIREAGEDDVILLNDDALLESPSGFTCMAEAAASHPEIGIIGAACNNVGNPNQRRRDLPRLISHTLGLRYEERMVCFVCVYIPRRTIEMVGLLDERYIGYGMEDDDYCFEVCKAGLKLAIHDGCYMSHNKLPSSFRGAGAGDFRPNMQRFIDKHGTDNWGLPAEQARRKWKVA